MPAQEDIRHQQELLSIHRRNLEVLLRQHALQGGEAHATPVVTNSIRENRTQIARIKGVLRGWGLPAEDHPDDVEVPPQGQASQAPVPGGGNVTIHGGTFYGPVGPSGGSVFNQSNWNVQGNVYNIAGDLNLGASAGKDEFLAALRAFKAELDKAKDVPADTAEDVRDDVDGAIKAIDRAAPDKARAESKLESAKKLLADMAGAAPSALLLGKLLGDALAALPQLPF
ncbi:hypothetical protein F8S13_10640 [Chloroflexia bacterium SDU3-3]|nr:hypothetical protein F8S13_10640 [Chloroflexia bacterium SDU3-3]